MNRYEMISNSYEQIFPAIKTFSPSGISSTIAGLVVLRLVDDWLDLGPEAIRANPANVAMAREVIARIEPDQHTKQALARIIGAVESSERGAFSTVASSMLEYAVDLECKGHYSLSNDTLMALHQRAKRFNDIGVIQRTALQLAFSQRLVGSADAEEYYQLALHCLRKMGDKIGYLDTHVGLAFLKGTQGELSAADTICADVGNAAGLMGDEMIRGKILHTRACIFVMSGDTQGALPLMREAVSLLRTNAKYLEAVSADLASMLTSIGYHQQAKPIHAHMATTARHCVARWQATLNLMQIAVFESQPEEFELYRAALQLVPLPPWTAMWYHWHTAQGHRTFGDVAAAENEIQLARLLAERHNMHSIYMK